MSFYFVFLDVTDKTSINKFFVFRHHRFLPEVYGVGALNYVDNTLCKLSEIFGKGGFPSVFVVALHEVAVFLCLTGDWVSDGIGFCNYDIIFRIGVSGQYGVWPMGVAVSLVPWRLFHPWRWRVGLEVDARHPWRWCGVGWNVMRRWRVELRR